MKRIGPLQGLHLVRNRCTVNMKRIGPLQGLHLVRNRHLQYLTL